MAAMVDSMKAQLDTLQAELVLKKSEQDRLAREVQRLKDTSETLAKRRPRPKSPNPSILGIPR